MRTSHSAVFRDTEWAKWISEVNAGIAGIRDPEIWDQRSPGSEDWPIVEFFTIPARQLAAK
jgi:hypothetical protein